MEHLYIYYRVRAGGPDLAHASVLEMQRRLAERTGSLGRLLRAAEPNADGSHTWMEVYEDVSGGTAAVLKQLREDVDLDRWIEGAPHVERFVES